MSRRRDPDAGERTRVSVCCSVAQKGLIEARANDARAEVSTWVLAHLPLGDNEAAPLIINGAVAAKLRAAAARQQITPDRVLEQLLIGNEG